MMRFFKLQDYVMFLALFLVFTVGQNIVWYSLITLLHLVSGFIIKGSNYDLVFREEALVYVYGVLVSSLMEQIGSNHYNLHGAVLGNRGRASVVGLLYKKVSYDL